MENKDFNEKLTDILASPGDVAKMSGLLQEIRDDHSRTVSELKARTNESEALRKANDDLVKQNMALFLRIGHKPDAAEQEKTSDPDRKPSYDDLFDPKTGKLK